MDDARWSTSVSTLLARRTGAAGVVEQLNAADTRLVADHRLWLPCAVTGAAVTGGVVQRVHLNLPGDLPEAKTVVAITGTAAYWPSDDGRRATEVSAGCVECNWRRVVDQVARFRRTSYQHIASLLSRASQLTQTLLCAAKPSPLSFSSSSDCRDSSDKTI